MLLWWPTMAAHPFAVAAGLVGAIVLGGLAAVRGRAWPLVLWPWLGLFAVSTGLAIVSSNSSVRVFADRIEFSDETMDPARRTLRLKDAESVVVECREILRRRRENVFTVDYAIRFPGDRWVDLGPGRRGGPDNARRWFAAVSRLEAEGLGRAPHPPEQDADPRCIRGLRAALGDEQFRVARRMIGLSDSDFARYYSEPHEAYNRRVDNGQ